MQNLEVQQLSVTIQSLTPCLMLFFHTVNHDPEEYFDEGIRSSDHSDQYLHLRKVTKKQDKNIIHLFLEYHSIIGVLLTYG